MIKKKKTTKKKTSRGAPKKRPAAARKPGRKPVRKVARKAVRKAAAKAVRKAAAKAVRKAAAKAVRKAAPRAVRALALAETAPTPKRVDISLTGGFYHGWATVDGATVPLGPGGKGQTTVTLTPPNVTVAIGMQASGATTYSLDTTINGAKKSETGTIDGGTTNLTFTYPLSDFNL
jgi:hypothetical protein